MKWTALKLYQKAITIFSILYAAVFITMLVTRPGTKDFYQAFQNTYQAVPPLFAAICCFVLYQKQRTEGLARRLGWLFIGLGSLSFCAGQTTWTVYESVLGVEVPFPGWADAGYLGSYVLLLPGVCLLMASTHAAGRARLFMDATITASALGFLSWHFMIEKISADVELSLLGKVISIGYPLGDLAIIFAALVAFNTVTGDRSLRRSLLMVVTGTLMISLSDTVFLYLTNNSEYQTGSWADWGWSFGYLMIAYAALAPLWWPIPKQAGRTEKPSDLITSSLRISMPYLAVSASLGIIVWDDLVKTGSIGLDVYVNAICAFVLIMARQIFVILENQSLNRRMSQLNENLESMVFERTAQLHALRHLTKAVNGTLSAENVMREAASQTCSALSADAVAIWTLQRDLVTSDKTMELGWFVGPTDDEMRAFLDSQALGDSTCVISVPFEKGADEHWRCLRAPLRWQQDQVGCIGVFRQSQPFSEEDFDLIESIGIEVGVALEHARQHEEALEVADRDPVTNLLNHRAVHQRMESAFKTAAQTGTPLAVMMTDMNNFKLFNDTYGHFVGDQVLKSVAKALVETCREVDIVGRFGGDEFLVVMPNTDLATAQALAESVQARLKQESFCKSQEDVTVPLNLSFGLGGYPVDGNSRHEVLTIADANLYQAKISGAGIVRSSEVQRENRELRAESSFEILDALVTSIDNKDRYTRKHSEDVTEYSLWIAEELGLSEETMRVIRIGGLLHDVGKIGVPDEILRKPGRLTPEEYEVMKRHPRLGELIISAIPGMESIVDAVRSHHERWDGQGYPDQHAGTDIPFLGRLLAVPDAFSAMTTDRPYRKGMDWDTALEEIRANIGTQFDPEIAAAFISAAEKRRTLQVVEAEIQSETKKAA